MPVSLAIISVIGKQLSPATTIGKSISLCYVWSTSLGAMRRHELLQPRACKSVSRVQSACGGLCVDLVRQLVPKVTP